MARLRGCGKMAGKVEINLEYCKGCTLCVTSCNQHVLEIDTNLSHKGYFPAKAVHPEKCTGCTLCALMCPDVAITVYKDKVKR